MNKVYFFHDGDNVGWNFAANKFKSAKMMALNSGRVPTDFLDNPFVDIRGNVVKNHYIDGEYHEEGEIVKTEHKGELSVQQIVDLGLAWWNCMECGNDTYDIVDNETAVCRDCGERMEIPYKY